MFAKRERLPRGVFAGALARGRRYTSAHFSILHPEGSQGYAVVVPKKVARLSVTRHQLKRRVTAALRKIPLPSSLVVFPRAGAARLSADELLQELTLLISRISR